MKNKKSFINNNVIKLVLVMVIALSSFSLFACKEEEPVITSSITVSPYYEQAINQVSSQVYFTVELTEENPNQTITLPTSFLFGYPKLKTEYCLERISEKGREEVYIKDTDIDDIQDYYKIEKAISYYIENNEGELEEISNSARTNTMHNYSDTIDSTSIDYSTHLNEQTKKHVVKYTVDKSKFPEIYGNAPYENRYINYSLTVLMEDNSGDKEIDFVIDGATQVKNFFYDSRAHYTRDLKNYIYEKDKSSTYETIKVSAIDKETGVVLTDNLVGRAVRVESKKISDDMSFNDYIGADSFANGLYIVHLYYEGSETHKYKLEYVYLYVYESL
ncbi:MAG: hypothetical protein IKL82_03140 [Clostridia bacterium]|nr:hypothetical protein [Clostridia bacterium]